ncbi:CRISPR-associated protein Cas5d [Propionibacteriaceae bacterium ES.041]|uniref:type I-C CRISPR-associated protein Cas5c n=1 Tax=Enemella evansiae TaxID=2016499 RepID=UPI000B977E26|nr:type I-C CRISPR-associated protein Cas5c [Enemella evansiae]OYO04694.1 type I-C CRISPR-associated protein Cas5 [Enemella evansiae]PFG66072.1 CRISPR-associated protein Cas5d [Propionibacteriaceae bacterium ES.041]
MGQQKAINERAVHDWTGLAVPSVFDDPPLALQVDGEAAVFTRPEFSSERVSYPVITPTAAAGLFRSVFWKPQITWVIDRIEVLAPVKWATLRRNESETAITRAMINRGHLDVNAVTQQRMTTLLKDVSYRIYAHVWVHPEADEQNAAKWRDQFRRRLHRGQTFRTPHLGMREFHADVYEPDPTPPIVWTEDLGIMLHSIATDRRTGREAYSWFAASVDDGVLTVPRQGIRAGGS